jgi:hypothetical protein
VADADGTLYVQVRAVMNPLCALIDGLPLTFFGRRKGARAYMTFDAAIEWCRKEMAFHSREKYAELIATLEAIRERDEARE